MLRHNIEIKDINETDFSIVFKQEFLDNNFYLKPFELLMIFDQDVNEYQYSIQDKSNQEIITTGWLEGIDTKSALIKSGLGIIGNFIQIQCQQLDKILSDIIDFRYDIINNKIEEI